jgi:rubrerythrin
MITVVDMVRRAYEDSEASAQKMRNAAKRAAERGNDKRARKCARAADAWERHANMVAAELEAING